MTEKAWKCFRCNLMFKDEHLAHVHEEIAKHHVTKIRALVV